MATLTLSGFSLMANYSTATDTSVTPIAAIAALPSYTTAGSSITLLWDTTYVSQIEILADNGFDPPIDSGLITTQGSGLYTLPGGVSITTTFTLNAYDLTGALALTPTTDVVISNPPLFDYFGNSFGSYFGS